MVWPEIRNFFSNVALYTLESICKSRDFFCLFSTSLNFVTNSESNVASLLYEFFFMHFFSFRTINVLFWMHFNSICFDCDFNFDVLFLWNFYDETIFKHEETNVPFHRFQHFMAFWYNYSDCCYLEFFSIFTVFLHLHSRKLCSLKSWCQLNASLSYDFKKYYDLFWAVSFLLRFTKRNK